MNSIPSRARPSMGAKLFAVRGIYLLAGIGMSAWAVIVPFAKQRFHLDDATLGLILLSPGIGGLIAMPAAGWAVAAAGSRTTIAVAAPVYGLTLPLLALVPSPAALTVVLFVYGFVFGLIDIAMNGQAVVVERMSGRPRMSSFHAMYSIGGLGVAIVTGLLLRLGLSNPLCAALSGLAVFLILPQLPKLVPKADDLPAEGPVIALPNRASVVLGLCCFVCFQAEGAVTDWSTIFLHFSRATPLAGAVLGYAGFSVAMAGARLLGDRVVMRLGPVRVMRLGSALGVLGFLLAVAVPYRSVAVLGFFLVGVGLGNIAPLIFSAAARVPGMAASASVPAVVGLGYAGFLLGPVFIGLIAHRLGLPLALGFEAVLLAVIFFSSEAVAAEPEQ